ncbi:HD-GYP domain-containing protein [Pseudomonas matsuisoli]|uniref:Cyclic di-GMP phosphodiesterase n=1 Tax=Pseudomonas matsuisoli TaxID=1515666 RepID=A0A917UZH9_9PSED|nr:HD-GYP domain-containing protein [Pseudomonas matsuisoli]GGK00716.1 cyclic di-GMP phosphodiesterase [Pseudomonas matsuisoli]
MLKRIQVTDLQLGMYVQEFCGSWMDHPFWKAKFVVDQPKDLQRIRECGITELWIDTEKGRDVGCGESSEAVTASTNALLADVAPVVSSAPEPLQVDFEDEARRSLALCRRAKGAVMSMFSDARMGKAVDTEQALALVEDISQSVMRNQSALISLARLKTSDEYTYMHSVAVCALMIALARQMGLNADQVREAGMAGLLHDLGKMVIPLSILNKPGKLTDAEFAVVRGHPEAGARLLQQGSGLMATVIDVCLHHHEKVDGSGYPHRLQGDAISLFARMGAVCDVYDAVTSNRAYNRGWNPAEAIRKMAEWKGHFDTQVFKAFVKSVGIYPVGSLVRLESGRLGVVLEQNEKSLLMPRVRVFLSARSKVPIPQQVVDLAKPMVNDKIVGVESAEAWGLKNVDEIWSGMPMGQGSLFG